MTAQTPERPDTSGTANDPRSVAHRASGARLSAGDRVRIERDEAKYPSRGTWPLFRDRTGTVVEINRAGKGPTEYGVVFGKARLDGKGGQSEIITWFKRYELVRFGGDVA